MTILYFFDAGSRPSQEGLLSLDRLKKKHAEEDLFVWGITASSKAQVKRFVEKIKPAFPVLMDDAKVSGQYNATLVLPTICVLGPDHKILDVFQGGGKTTQIMLVRLAQRQLLRKNTLMAKSLSEEAIKKDPENAEAKAVKGYAQLKEGKIDQAEKTFLALAGQKGKAKVVGKEGMALVSVKKGDVKKALALAEEVEKEAPDRGYANMIKGDILYSRKDKKAAEAQYKKAVRKKASAPYQKAEAFNRMGRLYAGKKEYQKASELYDRAVEIDPAYIEATSNKGVALEKQGKWDQALAAYRKALSFDKDDVFARVLAKKAQQMLDVQKDAAAKQRMDKLVKDLAARFRDKNKSWFKKQEDQWTSRPMVMTFIDFAEKGGLSERDGFSSVFSAQLADQLNSSGRVKIVERVLMDRLLEELNLGSSELADKETALRLGNVMAAKLICTGSMFHLPDSTMLSMRFIDTETSQVPKSLTRRTDPKGALDDLFYELNRKILELVIKKYPLQGFVVQADSDRVMLNIGSNQGVVEGTTFDVIEEKEPVKYKGRMLKAKPNVIAGIEIETVEPDLSFARILNRKRDLKADDKVRELFKQL